MNPFRASAITLALLETLFCHFLMANTYYVSPTGDDTDTGLSPVAAWQSIAKANTVTFQPGDRLLFEAGHSFAGTLTFGVGDAGDAGNLVEVSSYGTGVATIDGGNSHGIFIHNVAGIRVRNLRLFGSGAATNTGSGIFLYNDLPGDQKLTGVELDNLVISGFFEAGIMVAGDNGNAGFSQVNITNCEVFDCVDSGIQAYGDFDQNKSGYAHQHLTVAHCHVYNIAGYNKGNHSGSGIVLGDVQHGLVEHSVAHDCGAGNTHCGGPVGIWFWDADSVVIQHCEAYNMSSGTGCDGGGFDLDGGVTHGIMQYNYSHDNDGIGFLVGQFSDARPMRDIIVRHNISQNDARSNGASILLFQLSTTAMDSIDIYHNTVYLSDAPGNSEAAAFGFLDFGPGGITNVRLSNNIFYTDHPGGTLPLIHVPSGYSLEAYGNHYFSTGNFQIDYQGTQHSSLANFRQSTGRESLNGNPTGAQGAPGLQAPGSGGTIGFGNALSGLAAYQLSDAAPARSSGIDLIAQFGLDPGSEDFYGNALQASVAHAGAYQGTPSLSLPEQDTLAVANQGLYQSPLRIHPNPSQDLLYLQVTPDAELGEVTLYTLNMQALPLVELQPGPAAVQYQLSLSDLSAGTYLLRAVINGQPITRRFQKR